jgi:hypothetical protein
MMLISLIGLLTVLGVCYIVAAVRFTRAFMKL